MISHGGCSAVLCLIVAGKLLCKNRMILILHSHVKLMVSEKTGDGSRKKIRLLNHTGYMCLSASGATVPLSRGSHKSIPVM